MTSAWPGPLMSLRGAGTARWSDCASVDGAEPRTTAFQERGLAAGAVVRGACEQHDVSDAKVRAARRDRRGVQACRRGPGSAGSRLGGTSRGQAVFRLEADRRPASVPSCRPLLPGTRGRVAREGSESPAPSMLPRDAGLSSTLRVARDEGRQVPGEGEHEDAGRDAARPPVAEGEDENHERNRSEAETGDVLPQPGGNEVRRDARTKVDGEHAAERPRPRNPPRQPSCEDTEGARCE